jgi:hypothetical protein
MKRSAAVLTFVWALCWATAAHAQSPDDGARFPANATVEFLAGDDDLGEQHRLRIARDPMFNEVVYDRVDPYEIGQWFVVPSKRGMGPGTYYWQACWLDFDSGQTVCDGVRTLFITNPRAETLALRKARSVVRQVYDDHGAPWSVGNGKRYGCHRVSRVRVTCRPSAWAGDTVVTATLRMVNLISGATRVRGKIVIFSEYCADVTPWRDCTETERVSGRYWLG